MTMTSRPRASDRLPHSRISALDRWRLIARQTPDLPALTSPGVSLTFAEAERLSDLAALELVATLDDSDAPVGILAEHSARALLAILTVLKAGRVHVFLDPHVPVDRLRHYVAASGLSTCLTTAATAPTGAELADDAATLLSLVSFDDIADRAAASTMTPHGLEAAAEHGLTAGRDRSGGDPISIVFTSGSTGHPKGVVQTHRSLVRQVDLHRELTGVGPDDRALLTFPLGFVGGFATGLGPLLNGAGLWCFDAREGGTAALADWLRINRLTAYYSTPYLAKSLAESLPAGTVLDDIRFVLTGGEAITGTGIATIRRMLRPDALYINGAGSSEAGGTAAAWALPGGAPVPAGVIPGGRAVVGTEIRIIGDDGDDVPTGELGEIVFVSDGLSGGYWHDDERTAERFSPTGDGRVRYRTGDLGRIDDDGNLRMAGRSDNAVKVRGYLVEPSEIEAALTDLDSVRDAVVIAQQDAEKPARLVAYIVPAADMRAPSTPALRRVLRDTLPEYMIPAEILQLTVLPRTERGKVDRLALPPVPERTVSIEALDQYEYVMAQVWCSVLEIPGLDADDDFMALGGDSLSTEELLAVVRERYGVSLSSSDLLSAPTLAEFTKRVQNNEAALPGDPDVVPLNTGTGTRPLFCIAGGGALGLTYLPLARQFPDRDVYAFQAHGMEERALPDRTVRAHAERVIRTMRIVQPHGPYVLVGHSFGGFVALEIAQLLRAAGEEVELLVLLDTFPRDAPAADSAVPEGAAPEAARAPRTGPRSVLQRQLQRVLPDGLPPRDQIARHLRAHLVGLVPLDAQKQFEAHTDHANLTLRHYVPQSFDGRVLYVMAETNEHGTAAWEELITGELIVASIDTDHTSLLREPEVQTLAAQIRRTLEPVA
ncbi:hypothetical protein AX769_16595 [Frondihabitans sp. PAMC 28766]|uniref:alpha/beta fold hydrolase n=1 Tax=Frondihabitans sp. PAMC 28766 TaxID=1795630 RepID=UPI00078DF65E|nr:non-ribosomal peptide synthetase [Frondihabitans sp. PAMC 28766]AMM21455.1 hypothetical protein AX769_16595 [Frondihabitans sp. PAMC 28766]